MRKSENNRSQPYDIFLLLIASIIGVGVCLTGIGLIPAGILMFGLILSIKTGDLGHLRISTKFIVILGYVFAILSVLYLSALSYGYYEAYNLSAQPIDEHNFKFTLLFVEYDSLYQIERAMLGSIFIAVFFLLGSLALNVLWLNPLTRQFSTIRQLLSSRNLDFLTKFKDGRKGQKIVSREALHPFSVADELTKWKILREQNAISDEEYERARNSLLHSE